MISTTFPPDRRDLLERSMFRLIVGALVASFVIAGVIRAAPPLPTVPEGFEIEIAAEAPIVERPVMACFDERGRLFLVDSSGANEPFEKLVKNPPHRIVVIEDTDGDGKFDRRTVFADKLVMPQGVLPYRGEVYTASPPSVWKLEDTDGDGVCDKRTEIVTEFGANGNGADIHGPFLGPDGWLYICDGRHGHKVKLADGKIDQGLAGGIFRFRTDGSGFERVCGGGFDNPVEIDFTEEGEMLGTVIILHGNPRQHCLVHWVEGGVYPRADQEQCIAEFKRTGDLLPPIKEFGHVAVAGMTRYRSEGFGPEYQNNLFITFFNRHKVIRSILERSGSTFTSREEEFLTSDDKDFHPTDVLEDADGSLLVIDTGGWFRIGCPVSEIAKPDVLGAIYRIRKKGMKKIDDPRGLELDFTDMSPDDLVPLLDDPRPAVRDRAIDRLATWRPWPSAVNLLLESTSAQGEFVSRRQRRNAVWAISRLMCDPSATAFARYNMESALQIVVDREPTDTVRLTAAHALAHSGDWVLPELYRAVAEDRSPSVRAASAVATWRMSNRWKQRVAAAKGEDALASLVLRVSDRRSRQDPDLLKNAAVAGPEPIVPDPTPIVIRAFESIRRGELDPHLEHALIYELIQIGGAKQTLPYLRDRNPQVRRAALIALDQMDDGNLTREDVTPLLDTDDPQLRKTALAVIASRKGWATELVGLLRGWLQEAQPSEEHLSLLRGTLLAQAGDPAIQQLIGDSLAAEKTSPPVRLLLWEVIDRASLAELPEGWLAEIQNVLHGGSPAEARQVIGIVGARKLERFDDAVLAVARRKVAARDLRIEAISAVAPRMRTVDDESFALLADHLKIETPPLVLLAAARGLA